jgi:hypothetical protein
MQKQKSWRSINTALVFGIRVFAPGRAAFRSDLDDCNERYQVIEGLRDLQLTT